jgi:hypothetical protein
MEVIQCQTPETQMQGLKKSGYQTPQQINFCLHTSNTGTDTIHVSCIGQYCIEIQY